MRLVVDANVLFAALIRQNATFLLLFENSLRLYAPEFIFEELALHKEEVTAKASRSPQEFDAALAAISSRLHQIPLAEFANQALSAQKFSSDPKDVPYLALALHLGPDAAIWSNDKKLLHQDKVAVVSTTELIELLYHKDPYANSAH